jgi:hypothetical protein
MSPRHAKEQDNEEGECCQREYVLHKLFARREFKSAMLQDREDEVTGV